MSFRACTEANDMEVVRTMAKASWKMPEDFLMKVSRLADKTDEIIPKVQEAGAEVVEDKVRSNLQSVIGSGTKYDSSSTGELLRSLGTSPALQLSLIHIFSAIKEKVANKATLLLESL